MKKTKKMIGVLLFLLGLFYLPMQSQASSSLILPYEDKDLPAVKDTYVRFLNHKGETFPEPLALEAREIRVSYVPLGAASTRKNLDDEPVLFTTEGQSNIFYFDRTGNEYRKMRSIAYQKGIADWKITTPIPYVKYFSTEVPPGVTPVPDLHGVFSNSTVHDMSSAWRSTSDDFSVWRRTNYALINAVWEEQPDGSFLQTKGTAIGPDNRIVSTLGYSHISVNENAAGIKASGTYYGIDGEGMTLYAYNKGIKEIFEDETGASITAPSGYTDGKWTEMTTSPFTYTMENGEKLPETYTINNQVYKYQGWYKGKGNQGQINGAYPPNITFAADFDEQRDEVHIVYKKINAINLTEKYMDENGAVIDSSWNRIVAVEKDANYTFTPESPKKDSAGASWIYDGWKLSSDAAGTKRTTPVSLPMTQATEVHYIYRKAEHVITERWVNEEEPESLLSITPNPNRSARVLSNEGYSYTPELTLTDNDGNIWIYNGWENKTAEPGTVYPSDRPVSIGNVTSDQELYYYYKRSFAAAALELTATPKIVDSDEQVQWKARLTNTGEHPLTNLFFKASYWSAGFSVPSQLTVTLPDGSVEYFTVSPEEWETGIELANISLVSGQDQFIDIQFESVAVGTANQVLEAEVEITGNLNQPLKAEDFVRIDDPDEPNLNQEGKDALINIPDFLFGTANVSSSPQTKGLDAASYHRADYQPYIRYKLDSTLQGDWSVRLSLGQFISGTDSLSTSTSISLKNGTVKKVDNFNKENETLVQVGFIGDKTIPSTDTSVDLGTFSEAGVYQIDYDFNDVELNLPETTSVMVNTDYQAKLSWNLTTGP